MGRSRSNNIYAFPFQLTEKILSRPHVSENKKCNLRDLAEGERLRDDVCGDAWRNLFQAKIFYLMLFSGRRFNVEMVASVHLHGCLILKEQAMSGSKWKGGQVARNMAQRAGRAVRTEHPNEWVSGYLSRSMAKIEIDDATADAMLETADQLFNKMMRK